MWHLKCIVPIQVSRLPCPDYRRSIIQPHFVMEHPVASGWSLPARTGAAGLGLDMSPGRKLTLDNISDQAKWLNALKPLYTQPSLGDFVEAL